MDRVVVVADNCTDRTASIARCAGAEVVERFDLVKRGKGYALDAGVQYLSQSPTEVVIIFDADCEAEPGLIDTLGSAVAGTGKPVQALYLMRLTPDSGAEAMVSVFAFLVKNWVRARALQAIHLPVLLTGSGMAFPWGTISTARLANGEIVEDLALGIALAKSGQGAEFLESPKVWSTLPDNSQAAVKQRTRWEHGYISSMFRFIPTLIAQSSMGKPNLAIVALDLIIPPLSLLVLLSGLSLATLFFFGLATQQWAPFLALIGIGTFAAFGIGVSWFCFAREIIPARMLLSIPRYVLCKIPIYTKFVSNRETTWIRTEREGESTGH